MDGRVLRVVYCVSLLVALQTRADKTNNEWHTTLRAASMGNVGITTAEDSATAMFYNPALLARQKKINLEFFNPLLEMGFGNLSISQTTTDHNRQMTLKNAYPLLRDHKNKVSSGRVALYPNFFAQNFSIGVLGSAQSQAYVDSNGTLVYRARYLVMPTVGMSVGIFSGRIRIGIAARAINITSNDRTTTTPDGHGYSVNAQEGFGLGGDAGVTFTLPWAALPTFGAVVRNIGSTKIGSKPVIKIAQGLATSHDSIPMTFDTGFSISPKISQRSTMTIGAEYRDATDTSKTPTLRKVNFGVELNNNRFFQFRFGASRGYWTAGIGFTGKSGSLEIGSWADEASASGFRKVEDRRFSMGYGGRF